MALTVPDIARFTILGRWSNGKVCANVLDYQIDTTGSTLSRADAIVRQADDIIENWQSQVMDQLVNNYSVEGIHYIDLNTETGTTGDRPVNGAQPTVGQLTAAAVTPNVAVLVKKLTQSARGSRAGRIYLPGVEEDNVSENGILLEATVNAIQAVMDTFLANTNQGPAGAGDHEANMVVSHLGPPPDPGEEDNRIGTYSEVQDLAVQSVVATQRRRLR